MLGLRKLTIAALLASVAGAVAGFTVNLPSVDLGGGVMGQLDSVAAPSYPVAAAAGVFEMWPSLQFEVNGGALPAPSYGFSTLRKRDNTSGAIQPESTPDGGAFRIVCATSHLGFFDPIVYPPVGGVGYPK